MTETTTTTTAKLTDYSFDAPVQPPDSWTVDLDGRELNVHTEYEEGELRITDVHESSGPPRFGFHEVELTPEQAEAVHAEILAEIEGFNLPMLADIVRAIIRDTQRYRDNYKMGGVLDNWRQISFKEQMQRAQIRRAAGDDQQADEHEHQKQHDVVIERDLATRIDGVDPLAAGLVRHEEVHRHLEQGLDDVKG